MEGGEVFLAPITVGGQSFDVVVDTGSSDPWLAANGFECIDPDTGAPAQSEAQCMFGSLYYSRSSSTYIPISDENFNITYADGEQLNGNMAYESFTFAGITVPKQEMGVVNYAAWYGDGYSSGLVGMCYKTLTNSYSGTNPSADEPGTTITYNPLFVNMYTENLTLPVFSMVIDRTQGGILALGGLPPVPFSPYFASSPIVPLGISSGGQVVYEFYTITIDGFAISASQSTQFNPFPNQTKLKTSVLDKGTAAIVDSGTSLLYAPNDIAEAVAMAFDPPGTYDDNSGAYDVDCDAIPPLFGVDIAKKVFYVNPADLILPNGPGLCVSGVVPNNGGHTILGDVWMKNVVAVFDLAAEQMHFAAREFYGLTAQIKKANT